MSYFCHQRCGDKNTTVYLWLSTHPFVLWAGSLKELSRVGLNRPLSPTAGHLQLGHLSDVLPVGIMILSLLLVCQLADVIRGFLGIQARHAWSAVICHLKKWGKSLVGVQHSSKSVMCWVQSALWFWAIDLRVHKTKVQQHLLCVQSDIYSSILL